MNENRDPVTGRVVATHGKAETAEYRAWASMMTRCYNPNYIQFKDYGGCGIDVCDRWHEAANFLQDVGLRPSAKHSLGRIDNSKGYSPENCRWETDAQQAQNRKTTKLTMAEVREMRMLHTRGYTQAELAKEFKVCQGSVSMILHRKTWKEE